MVKHIYLTLAALLCLALAVSAAPVSDLVDAADFPYSRKVAAAQAVDSSMDSDELTAQKQSNDSAEDDDDEDEAEDDDDDDDDDSFIRRRREAVEEPAKMEQQPAKVEEQPAKQSEKEEAATETAPTAAVSSTTRKPVLVLIHDALQKVTTKLPTDQVANNALHYFQLFEHFIQQTIEQVIDAADEDEDEPAAGVTALPATESADKQPEPAAELPAPVIETSEQPAAPAVEPVAAPAAASNAV
ncbi:nucleolin [Drosophila busckii]|uniref:nucleolin n=1 Tax=Drosophila busckii TaxID=30019 RepID=UPI00083EA0DB|nr:nucleolin [Drosophila busckii]